MTLLVRGWESSIPAPYRIPHRHSQQVRRAILARILWPFVDNRARTFSCGPVLSRELISARQIENIRCDLNDGDECLEELIPKRSQDLAEFVAVSCVCMFCVLSNQERPAKCVVAMKNYRLRGPADFAQPARLTQWGEGNGDSHETAYPLASASEPVKNDSYSIDKGWREPAVSTCVC